VRAKRGESEEQGSTSSPLEDSRRLQASLSQRRKRLEKEMLMQENALEAAARCVSPPFGGLQPSGSQSSNAVARRRDEKEAIVDKLDTLKAELDEARARARPAARARRPRASPARAPACNLPPLTRHRPQVCGKLLPNSVADILTEYSTVWYIDDDQADYSLVADAMGVVACSGSRLHCAQDVHFNWRWLEDPNAVPMRERPACLKRSAPMSFRQLQELGLNVVCAHRMVAPRSLVSFDECSSWEQANAAVAAAAHALRQLKADGWQIDNSTYCSDASQLLLVKHLPPLRTLQHEAAERALLASPNVAARERGGLARVPQQARPDVAARKKKSRVRSKRVQDEEFEA
jgi:hypothetical protein